LFTLQPFLSAPHCNRIFFEKDLAKWQLTQSTQGIVGIAFCGGIAPMGLRTF
jgi:hypothetical protein